MKRRFAVGLAVAFAALALCETFSALTASRRVASMADWKAASAEVRAGFRPGDLIVFAPYWADQTGREHLGDLIPVAMAGRSDADRYDRIWEVSIRGAHAPDVHAATLVHSTRHGLVTVALYTKPAVQLLEDFTAQATSAVVTEIGRDGVAHPCYHDGAGFRCSKERVTSRTLEIDYRPRRGILAPAEAGKRLHIQFSSVPLGRTLVAYSGLHDYYARKHSDAPVDFRVLIDGQERLHLAARNEDGWHRSVIDTAALAGSSHTVAFEIWAAQPAWRNFGFHAETRR